VVWVLSGTHLSQCGGQWLVEELSDGVGDVLCHLGQQRLGEGEGRGGEGPRLVPDQLLWANHILGADDVPLLHHGTWGNNTTTHSGVQVQLYWSHAACHMHSQWRWTAFLLMPFSTEPHQGKAKTEKRCNYVKNRIRLWLRRIHFLISVLLEAGIPIYLNLILFVNISTSLFSCSLTLMKHNRKDR